MSARTTSESRILHSLGLAFFGILLLRTAWLSDVAYLTLRTIEHAAEGFGLRWNVADRVQVYDHPLWMMVLLAGRLLSGETYFTTIAISIAASLTGLWLVLRSAAGDLTVVVVLGAAVLSPLFLSFSTSGLETPLLHLLAAAFVAGALAGRSPVGLVALGGLLLLTHWTMVFFVAPVLAPLAMSSTRRARMILTLSLLPAPVWQLVAWWYYGTVGPNGWIAARAEAAEWGERIGHGLFFLAETTRFDPLFVVVLFMGLVFGAAMRGAAARVALGSALAIAWAILSGGSVMAGRHLTVPFVVGLILAGRYLAGASSSEARTARGIWLPFAALAAVLVLASMSPVFTLTAGTDYGRGFLPTGRPHDPRLEDYQATGLLLESRPRHAPADPAIAAALQDAGGRGALAVSRRAGMIGFAAGPGVYVLDRQGRTDPLIARLPPAVGVRPAWAAERRLPDGYLDALPDGRPTELALDQLTGHIRAVTRGALLNGERAGALFRLPRRAPELVAASSYGMRVVPLASLGAGPVDVGEGGVELTLPAAGRIARVAASLTAGYSYRMDVINGTDVVATVDSPWTTWGVDELAPRALALERALTATALRFRCGAGVGRCVLGEVIVGE